jgi:hypothetical protein
MDKGFRRIAFTIMGLTALTVISVGVYLWYNFNARSRLVLVVPSTAQWFLHVQTKLLRGDFSASTTAPEGIDVLRKTVAALPIFQGMKDAGEPGIALYSDVVSFGMPEGQFLALSITSEERFKTFMKSLKKRNLLKGGIDKGRYFYAEFPSGKAYVAFKYKALVIFKPGDSSCDYHVAESAFDQVFAEKTHTMMQNSTVQALYEEEPEVVFYSSAPAFGLSQSLDFPTINNEQTVSSYVKFAYPGKKGELPVSPLMLVAKAGYPIELEKSIDKENRMTAQTALDLMAKILDLKIREIAK